MSELRCANDKRVYLSQDKKSQLTVYRCRVCNITYNLYSGTIFQRRHFTPQQAMNMRVMMMATGFAKCIAIQQKACVPMY